MSGRILVCCGPKVIDICTSETVRRYLRAPNAEIVRSRRGEVVRVVLSEESSPLPRLNEAQASDAVIELLLSTEHSGPRYDPRPSTQLGYEFLQSLPSGRVHALHGVTGSGASEA